MRHSLFVLLLAVGTLAAHAQPVPPPNADTWTLIGPTRTLWPASNRWTESSGRIRSIAVDPSGTVYIGAAVGGIWKRIGSVWTPLTDFQPSLASGAIAIDPAHSNTIYVGTGEIAALPAYYGHGILKSTDGGNTWTNIIGPFLSHIENFQNEFMGQVGGGARFPALAVSPTDSNVLLAAVQMRTQDLTDSGIYRSDDAGLTWTPVLTGDIGTSVLFDPSDGHVAYAALGSLLRSTVKGIYKSTDAGQTWSLLSGTPPNTLPTTNVGQIKLAIAASSPRTLYAGITGLDFTFVGLYKTTDGGLNWTRLGTAPAYCSPFCNDVNEVAVNPRDPNIVLLGGSSDHVVSRSRDGGMTWDDISGTARCPGPNGLHFDVRAFAFSPDGSTAYVANDGGIASSTTISTSGTWNWMNDNLAITQFYGGFDVDPSNPDHLFAGTQDNGFQILDGSLTWSTLTGGEGGNILYDASANTAYLAGSTIPWVVGSFSTGCPGDPVTSGAYIYHSSRTGISVSERSAGLLAPLALNRSNVAVQYTGTDRVYQTTNGQGLWSPISPVLGGIFSFVTAIAVSDHNPDVVWAGTSDGHVWSTANASAGASSTWTDQSAGLPGRYVTQIAINHFKEYIVAVSFSGFSGTDGDTRGDVFYTLGFGTGWTDISGTLPNTPVNALIMDDLDINQLYAGTDVGVFRTLDRGVTWASLARGLPHTVVSGLYLHQPTRTLFAGTMGRSIWRITAPNALSISGAAIALRPWIMRFTVPSSGSPNPPPQILAIISTAPAEAPPLKWTATASTAFGRPWLHITQKGGVGSGQVSVSVKGAGLPVGLYNGIVRIDDPASTNGPQELTVLLEVTPGKGKRPSSH